MPEYDVIKKGEYLHPQKDNSIPVDNFLFIREDGKKYLLLSFNNTRKSLLTGLSLEITQLDSRSKEICTKSAKYGCLSGAPGKKYVLTHKIELDENCEDIKVSVAEALYGQYAYTISNGREKIEVASPAKKFDVGKAIDEMRWENVIVSERTVKKRIILGILSCLFILLILVTGYMQLKKFEDGRTTFHYNGVEYAFAEDVADGEKCVYAVGWGARRSAVVIPAEVEGYTVTKISENAFKGNTRITSLTIEGDIPIEEGAFSGCKNLKTLSIEQVKNIGKDAFLNCVNLESYSSANLVNLEDRAFANCRSLSSVDISNETRTVTFGSSVFSGCIGLSSVRIAQSVNYPRDGLFNGCNGITRLRLKSIESGKTLLSLFGDIKDGSALSIDSVTIDNLESITEDFLKFAPVSSFTVRNLGSDIIGSGAFDGTKLATLKLPVQITEAGDYSFRNTLLTGFDAGALTSAGDYAFYGTALTEFDGTALTHIGDYAFSACRSMSSFTFGDCTYLGEGAFADSTALTAISYPSYLSYIPESAFSGCTSLKNISLNNGRLASIGALAFNGCTALKGVNIPDSVKSIGKGAFGNTLLESISVPFIGGSANQNTFLTYIFGASSYNNAFYYPPSLKSVTLTQSDKIPENGLYGCASLLEFNFPVNISEMGASAFANCTSLENIKVPDSVTHIGKNAFAGCKSLKNISLPFVGESRAHGTYFAYVFGAGNPAGSGAAVPLGLGTVTITDTTGLPENAFAHCYYLNTVNLAPSSNLISVGKDSFYNCQNLKSVSLPEGLKEIGDGAFRNCIRLSEFTVPAGVTSFGGGVFSNCFRLYEMWNLSAIDGITAQNCLAVHRSANEKLEKDYLGGFAIAKVQDERYLTEYPAGGTNLTLPLTSYDYKISNHLFYADWTVKNLTIPSCVSGTGVYAFNSCTALNSVTFNGDTLESIGVRAFADSAELTKVVLPSGIKLIEEGAFTNCPSLTSVNLPKSLTEIGNQAFAGCMALPSAELGENLTSIGSNAFYGCEALKTAALNEGLLSIGQSAFEGCFSLTEVHIPSTLTFLGARAFAGCQAITKVEIKEGLTAIADQTFFGNYGLSELTLANSIQSIGDRAFEGIQVTYLTLPASLESVGEMAFALNPVLRSVVIPQKLTVFGDDTFGGCGRLYLVYNLGDLEINPYGYGFGGVSQYAVAVATSLSDAEYADIDGVTYIRHKDDWLAVWGDEDITSIDLKPFTYNGFKAASLAIHDSAFNNSTKLKTVTVSGVASIGSHAFADCFELESFTVRDNLLESIGYYAFAGCYRLAEAILPDSLTELPAGIFSGDNRLEKFSMPASVTTIGESALNNCNSLKEITIPDGLISIGQYAFRNCSGIESIVIPESVETISDWAFEGCNNLLVVYNLCDLGITEHSYSNGMAGYYAVKVFTNNTEEDKAYFASAGGRRFVNIYGKWYFYKYDGYDKITYLPESFSYEGQTVTEYTVKNYSLLGFESVVIPKAVKEIEPYAFTEEDVTRYGATVYFTGSAEEWGELKPDGLEKVNLYLYTDCVHEGMRWTYDSGGRVSTEPDAHGFSIADRLNATCTEDGYITYKCNNCDYNYTVTDFRKGHMEVKDSAVEPTCTEKGLTEGSHCGVCGETLKAQEEIPVKGHTPVTDEGKQPTCTEKGLTEGSHCEVCGETLTVQQEIPATGHEFDDDGACTVCGTRKE